MVADVDAICFARDWAAAWNRRDLEAVLRLFHEDAVFNSPLACRMGFGDGGRVSGKEEIRRYWAAALATIPTLHFEVREVYESIDTLVIAFHDAGGERRAEILTFLDGLIVEGHGAGLICT
jgi:uncharacterized protein (TIGR02246 family)